MGCKLLRTKVEKSSGTMGRLLFFYLLAKVEDSLPELNLLFSEAIHAVIDGIVGQAPLLVIIDQSNHNHFQL